MSLENQFNYNCYGNLTNMSMGYMEFQTLLYSYAATILKYTKGKTYRNESENPNEIDHIIGEYTNWADGCALNNTLTFMGNVLYDFVRSIATLENPSAIYPMLSEAGYEGYAIHGKIKHHAVEIITDALVSLDKYFNNDKGESHTDYNHTFLKVCGVYERKEPTTLDLLKGGDTTNAFWTIKRELNPLIEEVDIINKILIFMSKEEKEN